MPLPLPRFIAALFSLLTMTEAVAHDFKAGQVWAYRTRANEAGSTLLINRVEADPKLGAIFHISISGVKVKNRRVAGGITQELPHFPVSRQTLDASVLKLVGTSAPNPGYLDGYAHWKQAFDHGQAGIFTIPVSEIVSTIERVVNQP